MSVKYSLAPLCQVKDLTGLIKNLSRLAGSSGAGVELQPASSLQHPLNTAA